MQILIQTDNHIEGTPELTREAEGQVERSLGRFGDRITRVEVHLSDVNADKGGRDIRCVMEARAAGFDPVAVDDLARDVERALRGAAEKLERALETRIGKRERR